MTPTDEFVTLLRAALEEDRADRDITTCLLAEALAGAGRPLSGTRAFRIVAKEAGVFAGARWVRAASELGYVELSHVLRNGSPFMAGDVVVEGRGEPAKLLAVERSLLNGLQRSCGVATLTRAYVAEVEAAAEAAGLSDLPGVYHTRKTTPLLRDLERAAVEAGGGKRHRRDLSEFVLFKDNHKEMLLDAGLGWAELAQARVVAPFSGVAVWIEVDTEDEALRVCEAGFDRLLLDNFTPERVRGLLARLPAGVEIEVSGGLKLGTLAPFVIEGVARLSVGALTHGARAVDLSLDF